MSINYDPDAIPEITREMLEEADQFRLHPVHVICDEAGAQVGDAAGVSFIALVSFLPRAGDRITLTDGSTCEVKRTYFKVAQRNNDAGRIASIHLIPTLVAHKIDK